MNVSRIAILLAACLGMLVQAMPSAWCPTCATRTRAHDAPSSACCCCADEASSDQAEDGSTHLPGHCDDDCSCPTCATVAIPYLCGVAASMLLRTTSTDALAEIVQAPCGRSCAAPFHPPRI